MSKRAIILTAAGVLLVGGAVVAVSAPGDRGHGGWHRGGHGHGGYMMEGMRGDGMRGRYGRALTKDDFDTRTRERFARLDRNSDGVIEKAELETMINERMASRHGRRAAMGGQRMLHRMGAGADGKATKEEYRAEITRRFSEADLNGDGKIDDADLPPMMRGRNALSDGMARGHRRGPMRWMSRLGVEAKDGAIVRDDVLAAADRQFDRLDRTKDGVVDQADIDALRKEQADYRVQRLAHRMGGSADGRVTREQFQAKAAERFARMDVDGNGTIDRSERPGRWGRGGHHGGKMGHGHGHGMHRGGDGPMRQPGDGAAPPSKQ